MLERRSMELRSSMMVSSAERSKEAELKNMKKSYKVCVGCF